MCVQPLSEEAPSDPCPYPLHFPATLRLGTAPLVNWSCPSDSQSHAEGSEKVSRHSSFPGTEASETRHAALSPLGRRPPLLETPHLVWASRSSARGAEETQHWFRSHCLEAATQAYDGATVPVPLPSTATCSLHFHDLSGPDNACFTSRGHSPEG